MERAAQLHADDAGVEGATQFTEFAAQTGRVVARGKVANATVEEVALGEDGMVYALVRLPFDTLEAAAAEEFRRSEEAAYAEWRAEGFLERLPDAVDEVRRE